MAPSKNPSQSTSKTPSLQVPSLPSSRTLRPPSPAQSQPGYVATPKYSRTSLIVPSSDGDQSGPLADRSASPRPPTITTKKKTSKAPAAAAVKPNAKGKVSFYFWDSRFLILRLTMICLKYIKLIYLSRLVLQLANGPDHHQAILPVAHPHPNQARRRIQT